MHMRKDVMSNLMTMEANQAQLVASLARVKGYLSAQLGEDVAVVSAESTPPTLDAVRNTFGLSPFESDLLLLCAGVQLDSTVRLLCTQPRRCQPPLPDFWPGAGCAARRALERPDTDCAAALLAMLDIRPGPGLTDSELRIDERILHFWPACSIWMSSYWALSAGFRPFDHRRESIRDRRTDCRCMGAAIR